MPYSFPHFGILNNGYLSLRVNRKFYKPPTIVIYLLFMKKNYRREHCYYSIVAGYIENGKVKRRIPPYLSRLDSITTEKALDRGGRQRHSRGKAPDDRRMSRFTCRLQCQKLWGGRLPYCIAEKVNPSNIIQVIANVL